MPRLVCRTGRPHSHRAPTQVPTGDVGLVFSLEGAARAGRFYGRAFGWKLTGKGAEGHYFDGVAKAGIYDEAAASGRPVEPDVTLCLSVDALLPALARVNELSGYARHRRPGHRARPHRHEPRLTHGPS